MNQAIKSVTTSKPAKPFDMEAFKKRVITNSFKHKHISKCKMEEVKQHINLLELLVWWDKSKIKYKSGQFVLAQDTHVVIYNNMTYNHYTGEGFNPVDTIKEFWDLSFPQAYYVCSYFLYKVSKKPIRDYIDYCISGFNKTHKETPICSNLNYILEIDLLQSEDKLTKNYALRQTYGYLVNMRHIDRDIVSHLIHNRIVAMDNNYNVCFLTYRDDKIISAAKHGTNLNYRFKQNNVTEENTGFFYGSKSINEYKEIYVFESCIDLFSYLTLEKKGLVQPITSPSCFISCNGVSTKYLQKLLTSYPSIDKVHICFDNDSTGNAAATKYLYQDLRSDDGKKITADYLVRDLADNNVKDWNDLLIQLDNREESA